MKSKNHIFTKNNFEVENLSYFKDPHSKMLLSHFFLTWFDIQRKYKFRKTQSGILALPMEDVFRVWLIFLSVGIKGWHDRAEIGPIRT